MTKKIKIYGYPYVLFVYPIVVLLLPIDIDIKMNIFRVTALLYFGFALTYFSALTISLKNNDMPVNTGITAFLIMALIGVLLFGTALFGIATSYSTALLVYAFASVFLIAAYEGYNTEHSDDE